MYVHTYTGCPEGDIRLLNGRTSQEGRIEICKNNTWGTVCDSGWHYSDAQVVCRQLGFSAAGMSLIITNGPMKLWY